MCFQYILDTESYIKKGTLMFLSTHVFNYPSKVNTGTAKAIESQFKDNFLSFFSILLTNLV